MKTKKWLGLQSALSPYDAPAGSAQEQNNLQILLPGEAKPRQGMEFVYGQPNYVAYSVYAKPNGLGQPDTVLVHAADAATLNPQRGFYEVSSSGTYTLKDYLPEASDNHRPAFAEDRHGNVHVYYGHGVAPRVYRKTLDGNGQPQTAVVKAGLDAPKTAPSITLDGTGVFVERVDVLKSGGAYAETPTVSFSMGAGGTFYREAKARAVLEAGRVVAIEVTDGGSNYTQQPAVIISGAIGSGFTGKTFVSNSASVYSISNYRNYSVVAGVVTENNPPLAYAPTTTDYNNSTPAPALAATQTYGAVEFSDANRQITVASPVTSHTPSSTSLGSVTISGDLRAYLNYRMSYASGPNNLYASAVSYNGTTNATTVTLGNNSTLTIPAGTSITFWQTQNINLLSQPAQNTFTATVPLTAVGSGSGATAVVTFVDNSVQYSTPVPAGTSSTFVLYVVGDVNTYMTSTAGNGQCLGMQANPNRMIRGWAGLNSKSENVAGTDTGTPITAYWSDYSSVGYFVNTGTAAAPVWTQKSAPLQKGSVTVGGVVLQYAYADITLVPTGDIAQPSTVTHPTYRIKFAYCMTSGTYSWYRNWESEYRVGADNSCGPNVYQAQHCYTYRKWMGLWYELFTRCDTAKNATWWRNSIPQPIVDFWKDGASTNYATHYGYDSASTISRIASGANIPQNTQYQLRFCQQDASREVDTSDQGSNGATYRDFGAGNNAPLWPNSAATLTFNATQTIVQAGSTPPGDIVGTPTINSEGSGWASTDSAYFVILKREILGGTVASLLFGPRYTWSAVLSKQASSTDFITSATVTSGGSNYLTPPTILTRTTQGYGLVIEPEISNGSVTKLNIVDGGGGFSATDQPLLYTADERAEAIAVMRPAMQGVYRCAYRFADTSATVVGVATIATTAGSAAATLTYSGSLALAGLVLQGNGLPYMTKVLSATQDGTAWNVTLTQAATDTATGQSCTLRDYTKPVVYSNFSPIVDVDCGPNATRSRTSRLMWSISGAAPDRADTVELYRTSGDQSLVFYRLEAYGQVYGGNVVIVGEDTLNDEELYDSTRPNYAAMPIVLPNGGLNAFRFGVPRGDMASSCAYQDRLWYAGSTTGEEVNTVFFSEYDEFESCPPENSLSIQNNQRTNDSITALVPFGSVLLIMQRTHCYQLTYNTDPNVDAAIQLVANRGMANPQCHDIYNNILYALDEKGVYALSRSGEVEPISEAIADLFVNNDLDFSKKKGFFLKVDPQKRLLRAFVCDRYAKDDGRYPNLVLCYHLDYKVWWTETYANGFLSATETALDSTSRLTPVYSSIDGRIYRFNGVADIPYRSLTGSATVTSTATFARPPILTAQTKVETTVGSGQFFYYGSGGRFLPIMRNNKIAEIVVLDRGFGYGAVEQGGTAFASEAQIVTENGTVVGTIQVLPPSNATQRVQPPWWIKTNNYELANDQNIRGGDGLVDRSFVLTYAATENNATIDVRQFFNNSSAPRENVMPRNRGTGFVHETEGAKATLNMKASRSPLAEASGVAKAIFAGRSTDDMAGSDRHIAVGVYSQPSETTDTTTLSPATLYGIEMRGVIDGQ